MWQFQVLMVNLPLEQLGLGWLWAELHPADPWWGLILGQIWALCVWGTTQGDCEHWGWRSPFPELFLCWCDRAASPCGQAASEQGQQDLGSAGMLQPRGSHTLFFFPLQRGRVWKAPVSPCVWVPVSFPSPFHSQFIQCFFKSHYSWSTARCNRNVTFSHCIYSLQTLCDKLGSPGCSWSFLLCKYNYLTLH